MAKRYHAIFHTPTKKIKDPLRGIITRKRPHRTHAKFQQGLDNFFIRLKKQAGLKRP